MRVISLDATKLVVQNGCTSAAQQKWATTVLFLGMLGIYFLTSKVVGNLFYFWGGVLSHFLCLLLTCWYFAPVITTFDKTLGTVKIERFGLFITQKNEHSLLEIKKLDITKKVLFRGFSSVYLLLNNGDKLYLSNGRFNNINSQELLDIIKKFLLNFGN